VKTVQSMQALPYFHIICIEQSLCNPAWCSKLLFFTKTSLFVLAHVTMLEKGSNESY